ncbi:hypothetical protein NZK35_31845, partial [Stieleria sp. ICT_E10.1]
MDAALIALADRGVRFTFLGEPFRSWKKIPNEDVVDVNFNQLEINDADVEPLLSLTNLDGISFWKPAISRHSAAHLRHAVAQSRHASMQFWNFCGAISFSSSGTGSSRILV